MHRILFRTDGSYHIGFGHVMRCISMAEGLRELGFTPLFVVRGYNNIASNKITSSGFAVESFPKEWAFEQDLNFTLEHMRRYQTRSVVTDLNHGDTLKDPHSHRKYMESLRAAGVFLVTIGDFNKLLFPGHIAINPNYGADVTSREYNLGTRYLLGAKYFLFREEFIASFNEHRRIRRNANRILVTMGGSDLLGLTLKVIKALIQVKAKRPLEVCIILGPGNRKQKELSHVLSEFHYPPMTHTDPNNIAELMSWSDLTITAGGLTKYETAATGTPSVVLSQAHHQELIMEQFLKAGTTIYLGNGSAVRDDAIAEAVQTLLENYHYRKRMSIAGKNLVDGKGLKRVLEAFQELLPSN